MSCRINWAGVGFETIGYSRNKERKNLHKGDFSATLEVMVGWGSEVVLGTGEMVAKGVLLPQTINRSGSRLQKVGVPKPKDLT
jgi:hypothetical protein